MKKFLSVVSSISLLINSLFAPLTVIAQEISPNPDPTPIVENTVTPTPSIEATVEPTLEPSPTPTPSETPFETLIPSPSPTESPTTPSTDRLKKNDSVINQSIQFQSSVIQSSVITANGQCMQDAYGGNLNCTANDVSIAQVTNVQILDDGCQFPGDTVTFKATWDVQSTANQRYNVGLYFATQGQSSALTGQCSVSTLPNNPVPPWFDFDGNICGDIDQNSVVQPEITMTVSCVDTNNDNSLDVPYCTSWHQQVSSCSGPSDAIPLNPSKCNCNNGFQVPITVPYFGKIEVKKVVVPSSDGGQFNLKIDGTNEASCVGSGQSTGQVSVTAGTSSSPGVTHTVSENVAGCGTTDLTDYDTTISCVDRGLTTFDGGAPVTSSNPGPVNVFVNKDDDIVCTITNTVRNGTLRVNKVTVPNVSESFDITVTGSGTIVGSPNKVVAGGSFVDYTVTQGIYSVTETPKSGWNEFSNTCNNVSVPAGGVGECTITNKKMGHIVVDKVTYPAGESQSFAFSTTGSGYSSFNLSDSSVPNDQELVAGNYSVSENPVVGWDSTVSCSSSIQDVEVPGNLELDPDEVITCTFVNTKRGKMILEKQTNPEQSGGSFTFVGGVAGTISDNGQIIVDNVVPGQYVSTENDPTPNFDLTSISCDDLTNGGQASVGNVGARTITFNVDPGETVKCVVTNTQRGSIYGYKYEDINGNGINDDWVPISNWVIELWQGQSKIAETSTLVNGYFSFTNLVQGAYTLVEQILSGWTNVSTNPLNVTLDAGENDGPNNFVNTRYGTLILEKQTLPNGSSQNFTFSGNVAGTISDEGTITVTNVLPGTYTSTESLQSGWDLSSIVCDDSNSTGNIGERKATFNLESGETVKCTFTNTQRGHIVIEKNAIPDGSQIFTFNNNFGNGNPSTFNLVDDNSLGFSSYNAEVLPGTYSVSEDYVSGWQVDSAVCDNGETIDSIDVSAGETVTCLFTNKKLASITLVKNTQGGDGTFDFNATGAGLPSDIDLSTVGQTASQTFTGLDPDNSYSIIENVPTGWDLLQASCDNGDLVTNITPIAGENIICTFVNEKDANIIVNKQTIPNGSQQSFEFNTNYSSNFFLTDGGSNDSGDLAPGNYYVSEVGVNNWDLTNAVCVKNNDRATAFDPRAGQFNLNAGETIECTFTNSRKPMLNVIKNVINDNGGKSQSSDFTINVTGVNPSLTSFAGNESGTLVVLDPGSYSVDESYVAGYAKTLTDDCDGVLAYGDTKTCTITNDDDPGTLIVKKILNGGSKIYSDFGFSVNGDKTTLFETDGQNERTVDAGYYTVIEDHVDGYTTSYDNCTEVFVTNGGTQTCTITNTRDQGEIIIKKIIDEDGDLSTLFDQSNGEGWEIDVDGILGDVDDPIYGNTDSSGEYKTGKVKTGTYYASETQQDGYDFISASCSDGSLVTNIELSKDEIVTCTFYNTPNGTIHGYKWNDANNNGTDLFEQEEKIGDWTINLFAWDDEDEDYTNLVKTTTTDSNIGPDFGWYWFTHLFPGNYKVCEENKDGWSQTYPGGDGCHLVQIPDNNPNNFEVVANFVDESPTYNFGNVEDNPEIVITKSNNRSSGANINDVVTYTLKVTNTGNINLSNLKIKDAFPGGFIYENGSSYLDGVLISDPVITGGLLTWEIGDILKGEEKELVYKLKISDSAVYGSSYKNFATCSAFYGSIESQELNSFARMRLITQKEIECNVADSSVTLGTSTSYGGNLFGQVLGASTELPATGNPTWLFIIAMFGLTGGILLKKKYAKN